MVDYDGLMRWEEETQHSALRPMCGMCLRPTLIRAFWLPGEEQSSLGCRRCCFLTHLEPQAKHIAF